MNKNFWLLLSCVISVGLLFVLCGTFVDAAAQTTAAVCFWSDQGPVCVERSVAGADGETLMAALLTGPTPDEQARGLWSAIPDGTTLERVETRTDSTVVVYLRVKPEDLIGLDHETFEIIVEQIGGTLEPLEWRDLHIQAWDARAGAFVPLASFLPDVPIPRKEVSLDGEGEPDGLPGYVGQPPAPGQGQPLGALTGKTVYVSAGHGWQWWPDAYPSTSIYKWKTQRPPYPTSPYVGPIIEDHNNAEAVNQYFLQYLWNAGATVIPVRERDMNSAEVIVDNDAPGLGTGYSETGVWTPGGSPGYRGFTYRYATTVTGTATATAVWTATLPADGQYAVYVWYLQSGNRTPDAHYTIHHAGGETTVLVDQRIHGSTWHYVGTYGFLAGEEARVTLTNQSITNTVAVIADAVRFGGGAFDDLTDIETTAPYPSGDPWWEVSTFYYSQRMGMDQPPGDVTARPIYARWEHAGTGEDAVYVSWHTNGATGYQWSASGTETYVHNGVGLPRTEGSLELRHAIHTEVVHDIRAGWDPAWVDRREKQANYGELRLLWDDDPAARMPGALIEIAFHDHPGDTDALKEPTFEMLAARAIYQGIVKYFEGRDGVDLKLLPEPPTHLVVQNVGGGAVRVSWQPSPTDAVGLVGDAATGYRVYTSTNGIGWSNGVTVTATTAYTLTGLPLGQLVYVRVAATNAGGESFPTEVLAARVGSAGVLIVNGFDRLNRSMAVPETDPTEGYNVRLFLGRMNAYNYVIQHGGVIPYAFDSASNEAAKDGMVNLGQYGIVDWILGEESVADETLDATERALLAAYLDGGGALFISGAEIGYHLDFLGGAPAFYNGYLRAGYAGDDAGTYQVAPAPGSIFVGLPSFSFYTPGMYDPDYPDQIAPFGGAIPALAYQGGAGGTAAVQYADGCERVVYFGFPFETIEPGRRAEVMGQVLDFLDECLVASVETAIVSPPDGSAYNSAPEFRGTADAGVAALDRVEVQIERASDGQYWAGSGWVTATAWVTASGTSVWSYTLTALSDDDYTLRARAWTTDPYSDTSPAEAAFTYDTISPTATTLITPTGGITVLVASGATLEWTPVDPGGGAAIAYVVRLDGQIVSTTTQTSYATAYLADGPHTWGVQVIDAAGNGSDWASDDFFVSRYRYWLPLVVQEEPPLPPPCTDVVINGGFESDEGWVLNRLAVYTADQSHSGARSARVGIPPGEAGTYSYSSVMQTVTLTEGSSATLSLWVYPIGEGGDTGDQHYIGFLDEGSVYHSLSSWRSDTRAWELRQYDLSAYAGQTVTLYIGTMNDGDADTAALYVDDVVVQVCQ